MRRGLALTLTVAMLGSLLAGCGSSGGGALRKQMRRLRLHLQGRDRGSYYA